MEEIDPDAKAVGPRIPMLRFGLRFILICITLIGGWLAVVSNRASSQRRAVSRVKTLGGFLGYDYEFDANGKWRTDPDLPASVWLIDLIGEDYARSVWVVNFDEGSDPTNDDLAVVERFGSLKELTLMNRKRISDDGLRHLSGLTNLKVLALNGTSVNGEGLIHLRACRNLEGLPLSDTPLTDQGLMHLAGLTSLKWLHFNRTPITDQGLASLSGLTQLESLQLRDTAITDEGLKHLTQLKSLKKLLLRGTKTTDEGRRWLQLRLPNCKISD